MLKLWNRKKGWNQLKFESCYPEKFNCEDMSAWNPLKFLIMVNCASVGSRLMFWMAFKVQIRNDTISISVSQNECPNDNIIWNMNSVFDLTCSSLLQWNFRCPIISPNDLSTFNVDNKSYFRRKCFSISRLLRFSFSNLRQRADCFQIR